jgi:parvulin-like peptidyl-prolyl isomerase
VSKLLRSTSALGAVLFALVGIAACGGIPGDAVVQVGSSPITKSAFEHWMSVASTSNKEPGSTEKAAVPVPPDYTTCIAHLRATAAKTATKGQAAPTSQKLKSQCATQYKALQQEVLGFLISSQWVLSEAAALGVKVSDAEVSKEFAKIKAAQFPKAAEFEKFLATSGQTVSDLLLRVKLNLLSQKIQKQIIKNKSNVTEAQVTKYYNENKSKYGTPEKRNVRIILTKTEAAASSAKKEVESGKSFASVAAKSSIDPTSKAKGGLLKEVVKGEEEAALDTAIFSAAKGTLGGPVKTPFGYYVYQVVTITPGTQEPLSKVKTTIKQQLISTGEQSALSKFVKEFKKKWTSKTECRSGYVVQDCKSYKAPKTSGTAKSVE